MTPSSTSVGPQVKVSQGILWPTRGHTFIQFGFAVFFCSLHTTSFCASALRAIVRYCVWLLVLVKLVLPPTLALPTGIAIGSGPPLPPHPRGSHPAETIECEAERQHNPEPLDCRPRCPRAAPAPLTEPGQAL